MITVSKQENGVLFTFENSDKYLYGDGTILVPFNSLSIIADESDMITLRKSASYDIFLSARYDTDFGYASKEEAVNALKEILYDEAGISEEEVQQMIDAATSGIPSSQVVEQLRTDVNTLSGTVSSHTADTNVHFTGTQKSNYDGLEAQYYVDDNWDITPLVVFNDFTNDYSAAMGQFDQRITAVSNGLNTISGDVENKIDTATYESGQYATAQALNALQENKLDASAYTPTDLSQYWTSGQTQEAINAATSGIPSSQVIEQLRTDVNTISGATENLNDRIDGLWTDIDEKEEVIASALTQLNQDVSAIDAKEEVIASALTEVRQDVENKQDALQYYGEDTEQWEEEDGDNPDSTALFTKKQSDILTDDFGDEGSSQAGVQTRVDTVKFNGVLDTGQSGSLVNIYANESSNETTEYGSSIEVSDNGVGIKSSFIDYDDESSQRLTSIDMNHNDVSISLESTANGDSTAMVINTSGVTINDERVATEPYVDAAISGKVDTSAITTAITSGSTNSEIPTAKAVYDAIQAGGGGSVTVDPTLDSASTNPVANSAITNAINSKMDEVNFASFYGNQYNAGLRGYYYDSQTETQTQKFNWGMVWQSDGSIGFDGVGNLTVFNKLDTSAITTSMTSSSTDAQVPSAKAVYDQLGGLKFVKLTQAAYDALATKDSSTLYIISD